MSVDSRTVVALAELGARLAVQYVEARSRRQLAAMTPDEILAACRAIDIRPADDLLAEGQGESPAEGEEEPL